MRRTPHFPYLALSLTHHPRKQTGCGSTRSRSRFLLNAIRNGQVHRNGQATAAAARSEAEFHPEHRTMRHGVE
jgi:hypothetical protein